MTLSCRVIAGRFLCLVSIALAAALLSGCPGIGRGPSVVGLWQHQAGAVFADQIDGALRGLVLQQDGAAEVFTRDDATHIQGHYDGSYSLTDTGLVVQFPEFEHTTAQLLFRDMPDNNTLILTDAAGAASTFTRVDAVPDDARPRTFDVTATFTAGLPNPSSYTGLGFDYTSLWYTTQEATERTVRINPSNGQVTGSIDDSEFDGYSYVQAMQSVDFWMLCGCGGDEEVRRYTSAGHLADTVNTEDLGFPLHTHAVAYNPSAQILWLQGTNAADVGQLVKVNSAAEPNVLLDHDVFDVSFHAMAWDGTHLWAIVSFAGHVIIEIDVAGGTPHAEATYADPDPGIDWEGIAAVSGNLFLLGRNAADQGVLYKVTP